MIVRGWLPAYRRVASGAFDAKAGFMNVIFCMAGIAVSWGTHKNSIRMTFLTGYGGMFTC
jgi:hypothetical protein